MLWIDVKSFLSTNIEITTIESIRRFDSDSASYWLSYCVVDISRPSCSHMIVRVWQERAKNRNAVNWIVVARGFKHEIRLQTRNWILVRQQCSEVCWNVSNGWIVEYQRHWQIRIEGAWDLITNVHGHYRIYTHFHQRYVVLYTHSHYGWNNRTHT